MLLSISITALVITPAENSQVRSQSIKAILFIAVFAYTSPVLIMQEKNAMREYLCKKSHVISYSALSSKANFQLH